jgi:cellobiose phosphorylase
MFWRTGGLEPSLRNRRRQHVGENAHEFRLLRGATIRSASRGSLTSATKTAASSGRPPCRSAEGPHVARHGFGYSVYEHTEQGIRSDLWVYVAIDAPVKFAVLKLKNDSGRPRRLSVTGYVEWVLADLRSKSMMHIVTEIDSNSSPIFARNPYRWNSGSRCLLRRGRSRSTNRRGSVEFIGRNGTLESAR